MTALLEPNLDGALDLIHKRLDDFIRGRVIFSMEDESRYVDLVEGGDDVPGRKVAIGLDI